MMRKKTTMRITRRVAAPMLGKFERVTTDPYNGLNSYTPWALESPARIVECREDRGHYLVRVEIDMPQLDSDTVVVGYQPKDDFLLIPFANEFDLPEWDEWQTCDVLGRKQRRKVTWIVWDHRTDDYLRVGPAGAKVLREGITRDELDRMAFWFRHVQTWLDADYSPESLKDETYFPVVQFMAACFAAMQAHGYVPRRDLWERVPTFERAKAYLRGESQTFILTDAHLKAANEARRWWAQRDDALGKFEEDVKRALNMLAVQEEYEGYVAWSMLGWWMRDSQPMGEAGDNPKRTLVCVHDGSVDGKPFKFLDMEGNVYIWWARHMPGVPLGVHEVEFDIVGHSSFAGTEQTVIDVNYVDGEYVMSLKRKPSPEESEGNALAGWV